MRLIFKHCDEGMALEGAIWRQQRIRDKAPILGVGEGSRRE